MADRPDLSTQYQASSKALENLSRFKTQNPLLVTPMPTSQVPSSSAMLPKSSPATCHSPETRNATRFDYSRLHIPSTAYAHGHAPPHQQSPAGHIPRTASKPYLAPYTPRVYREPLECITRDMIFDRIYLLLRDNLPEWWTKPHDALGHLTWYTTDDIIRRGQRGAFGPTGLGSLTQIFVCIGHEDFRHYMCLAVQPIFGHVQVVLRGESCEQEGKDPILDHTVMALCREGFDKRAAAVYKDIYATAPRNRYRK